MSFYYRKQSVYLVINSLYIFMSYQHSNALGACQRDFRLEEGPHKIRCATKEDMPQTRLNIHQEIHTYSRFNTKMTLRVPRRNSKKSISFQICSQRKERHHIFIAISIMQWIRSNILFYCTIIYLARAWASECEYSLVNILRLWDNHFLFQVIWQLLILSRLHQ